ncbi:rhomboid-related protein 4-like isoform X2 [Larimichthys crocea]|uniref:rhomboid-related protein 4-like isoform X2 n=1 Tax=Larimichthys crocea TaxID=215358 RepID=UPI000F5EEAEB|nr:rhomboid-related protein 4-like isoform X2 [Larimichthys crocea]
MQRGLQFGLLLLAVQLFQQGLGNIPAVTLAVLGFNVYLFMFPAAPLMKACVSLHYVYSLKEWRRLFLSPLHHVDDWHLYYNMASFLWKGTRLERRLGGAWFLYLLSVLSLLTGLVYLLLQAWLTKLIQEPNPLWDLIDASAHSSECAVGFSGVLFALKVINNHYNPGGVTYLLGTIRVSNRFASWVELVLIYVIAPRTSLIGHLSGILVGLLYTLGPLRIIMETCAESVSSDMNDPRPSTYFNFSGYSGTRRERPQHAEDRTAEDRTAEDRTAEDQTDLDRMTEEEQIELAIRNSLNDRGPTRRRRTAQPPSGFHPTEEEENLEELRRRRLRRLEEEFYNQRRRRQFM